LRFRVGGLIDTAKQMYEAAPEGGYLLKPSARAAIEETNAEIQQVWETYKIGIAERDATLAAKDTEIERLAIKRDIGNALAKCGVKTSFFRAAEAVLLEHLKDVEVHEDSDGEVTTSVAGQFGRCTVASAVAGWLASDEGVAFRPKSATHAEGELQAAVRKLKTKLN
jgi:hypothetical protein